MRDLLSVSGTFDIIIISFAILTDNTGSPKWLKSQGKMQKHHLFRGMVLFACQEDALRV